MFHNDNRRLRALTAKKEPEASRTMMKSLALLDTPGLRKEFGRAFEQITRTDSNILTHFTSEVFEQFKRTDSIRFSAACFMASQEQQGKALQRSVRILAERGWFISLWHTPLGGLHRIAKSYTEGKIKAADQAMVRHFSGCLEEIEGELVRGFPNREMILRKAFEAHRNSTYELSVPVML